MNKKSVPGEYRNLQLMPGRDDRWEFEIKNSKGDWIRMTGLASDDQEARRDFAQRTADAWRKR